MNIRSRWRIVGQNYSGRRTRCLPSRRPLQLGYRYLETDIRMSVDGVPMVFHDATLERTTNGTGKVKAHTVNQLQGLDAGHQHEIDDAYPFRGQGMGIPTLEELLSTYPDAVFSIDMKEKGTELPLVDVINRLEVWDRVIVGSFSGTRVKRFRKLMDRPVATSAGFAEMVRFLANTRAGRPSEIVADSLQVPVMYGRIRVVDRKTVTAAHAAFKQVIVWTINDGDEMRTLLDLGVDGIITDRPDILRYVMEEREAGGPWHEGARRG